MTNESPALKTYRVTVIEWVTHKAYIDASDAAAADTIARQRWEDGVCHDSIGREAFSFDDSGIDGIDVVEI